MFIIEIIWTSLIAVKVNQTSSFGVPVQLPPSTPEGVAARIVPDVNWSQDGPSLTTATAAAPHSSLLGHANTSKVSLLITQSVSCILVTNTFTAVPKGKGPAWYVSNIVAVSVPVSKLFEISNDVASPKLVIFTSI